MKKIRTKIILMLLAAVILPLIPLSFFVNDLVNQSYQIGVNQQVAKALENGLEFSKQLYNLKRRELITSLEELENFMDKNDKLFSKEFIYKSSDWNLDSSYWSPVVIGFVNAVGDILWEHNFSSATQKSLDPLIFGQLKDPEHMSLIVSDRAKNEYVAVKKVKKNGNLFGFLFLAAKLDENFLKNSDLNLSVHQLFQGLNLTRHTLPGNFLLAFVLFAVFLVVMAIGLGIWFSTRITAPLSSLVQGIAEIGRGNLDFRLKNQKRMDEIGELTLHFNNMTAQLKENQERLIYLEKMGAWQQLARKLAHEIKNPLTPIQLTIQQLVDKYENKNDGYNQLLNECHSIIDEEIESLRRLVKEFSEFGRMPELNLKKNDLNKLILEISKLYGDQVEINLDQSIFSFSFDQDKIRRLFINLIENAVQASTKQTSIKIHTKSLHTRVLIGISDNGKGISDDIKIKIFEPYFSTKKEGTGLGLAICRLIVEEHAGKIWVESGKEQGSIFYIELPMTDGQV